MPEKASQSIKRKETELCGTDLTSPEVKDIGRSNCWGSHPSTGSMSNMKIMLAAARNMLASARALPGHILSIHQCRSAFQGARDPPSAKSEYKFARISFSDRFLAESWVEEPLRVEPLWIGEDLFVVRHSPCELCSGQQDTFLMLFT